jgi:hypothetical protein
MTTEANDNDPRVSDAYQEMANETTPAELDRKVLAMAAAGARPPRGLPRTWFRPLAWAATIALSFALVLEITQVDDIQVDSVATPRADADLAEEFEESALPADAERAQKDEARVMQQLNKRSSDAPAAAKAAIAPAQLDTGVRDAAANAPAPASPAASQAPESSAESSRFAPAESDLLREAEDQDRMRSERGRAVSALEENKEQSEGCGEDARVSVESWYVCIQVLRDTGQTELAQQELEALLVEFPDFREPPGDR